MYQVVKSFPSQRVFVYCPRMRLTLLSLMSGLVLACAPDIPNYEGFFDGLEAERCGNGVIDYHSEECDEGKDNDSRGFCSPTCKKARCGDGLVQLNEECDLGEDNAPGGACSRLCYAASCGDGIVQDPESCDLGPENQDIPYGTGCTTACQPPPTCGDGMLDPSYEACDDANDSNQDACTNQCQAAACGDGLLHVDYEACDDGNDDNTDACLSTCEYPSCGDGFVQAGEECDGQANCNESCIRDRYVFVTKKTHDGRAVLPFAGPLRAHRRNGGCKLVGRPHRWHPRAPHQSVRGR